MKHKRAVIALTCSIFVVVCVLSLYKLFSVAEIKVNYSVYNENVEEVESILSKYKNKSIFFVSEKEIEREITSNRYLKVLSVKKKYPCTIVVELAERGERYALKTSNGWYFLDDEFFAVRSSAESSSLRGEKLTLVSFYDVSGEEMPQNCTLKQVFSFPDGTNENVREMLKLLGDTGENMNEIRFVFTPEKGNYRILLYSVEGVVIEIRKAGEFGDLKLAAGIEYYKNLPVERKMRGKILVNRLDSGEISCVHTPSGD